LKIRGSLEEHHPPICRMIKAILMPFGRRKERSFSPGSGCIHID